MPTAGREYRSLPTDLSSDVGVVLRTVGALRNARRGSVSRALDEKGLFRLSILQVCSTLLCPARGVRCRTERVSYLSHAGQSVAPLAWLQAFDTVRPFSVSNARIPAADALPLVLVV